MLNIASRGLTDGELRFVQEVASVFASMGMASSTGRVYGYLLLKQQPMGLDEIASDLSLSKGGAWNAVRLLERYGHVRHFGQPGSKRALYTASETFGTEFWALCSLLGAFANVLQNAASTVATGVASVRLAKRARFLFLLRQTIEAAIAELSVSCQAIESSERTAAPDPEGTMIGTIA